MTRDDILNMPAGREMDALVAEKVMGWQRVEVPGLAFFVDRMWLGLSADIFWLAKNDCRRADINGYRRFSPSTDLAAAWEVVEKLQAEPDEYFFEVSRTPSIPYKDTGRAHWHCEFGGAFGYGDTAPLAICRTALLAVMP